MQLGILLLLSGLICALVGLVMAIKALFKREKKPAKPLILIFSAFLLIIIGSIQLDGGSTDASESDELPEKLEDRIKLYAKEAFGDENINTATFLEGNVHVMADIPEGFTNDSIKYGMHDDILKMLQKLNKEEKVKSAQIDLRYTLVDKYGNESMEPVMRTDFSKKTINKINFENARPKNLPDIADDYWKHQALDK